MINGVMSLSDNHTVTIKEVSERAGVAVSTVSRVLNGLDRVSDETREKVKLAASELGYVRNTIAASMKTGRTRLVVVIVPDVGNEYYTAVIHGVESVLTENSCYTVVFSSNDSPDIEREFFNGELGHIVDGAVIVPSCNDLSFYESLKKPLVFVDRYLYGDKLTGVVTDNYKSSYSLTNQLIIAGHSKIAFISGGCEFNIGSERFAGYSDAMKSYGLPIRDDYVCLGSWYQEHGYNSLRRMLESGDPPTAVYAGNNLIGAGCLQAMREAGVRVAKDISFVCFDDSAVASLIEPSVTVVRQFPTEMGKVATLKLLSLINEDEEFKYPQISVVPAKLIRRKSVAPPPGELEMEET